MAAFAEGWELLLNDEEVKAVLAKIGAIDDHHLNGVGADLAGNLLNEVKDELHQVTLPASLLTRVVTLAEQALWPKEWQSRDENREIPGGDAVQTQRPDPDTQIIAVLIVIHAAELVTVLKPYTRQTLAPMRYRLEDAIDKLTGSQAELVLYGNRYTQEELTIVLTCIREAIGNVCSQVLEDLRCTQADAN
uniref:DUF1380 family protein n=1 Tax=Hafnia alvei TaxID=569 RepID=UPI002430D3F5|nr:DUF1380 family protein [Hafnia alvei]